MITYFLSALWGALILASMAGWGLTTRRLLRVGMGAGWATNSAVGIALSTCLGGVFDLFGVISRPLIIGYLTIGAVVFASHLVRATHPTARATPRATRWVLSAGPMLAVALILLGIRVAGSVIVLQPPTGMQPGTFNTYDDFQAYMVYPLKMIQTGTMGADPFSVRRMPAVALGGAAFLQTFVLAALRVQSLRVLDVGMGTVLIVGLLWRYMMQLRIPIATASGVVLVFLLVPPPLVNITSVLLPAALFISLYLTFVDAEPDGRRFGYAALIGIQVAAIAALKTNLIPAALAFLLFQSCFHVLRSSSKATAARHVLLWFGCAGLAVLPWLLDAYRWTGTAIPTDMNVYHAHATRAAAFRQVTGWRFLPIHLAELPRPPYAYAVVLAALLAIKPTRHSVPGPCWSLLAAIGVGTAAVTLAVAGSVNDIYRFMYAFVISGLLIALVQLAAASTSVRRRSGRWAVAAIVGAATVILVRSQASQALQMYTFNISTTMRALHGERLVSPALIAKYRALQSVVPPGASLLERMDHPFLFDFGRNSILLDDMPGSASVSPGMPFFSGSESLAVYLLSHDIRYVAFDYGTEAGTPHSTVLDALARDGRHPSAQAVIRLIFDFHDNLKRLGQTRRRIYDDGSSFVLDLRRPAT